MKANITLGYAMVTSMNGQALPVLNLSDCIPETKDFNSEVKITATAPQPGRVNVVRICGIDGALWAKSGPVASNPTAAVGVGVFFPQGLPECVSLNPGDTLSICPG